MITEKMSDAAFIQSIAENQSIRDYCSKHNPPYSFDDIYNSIGNKDATDDDMKLFNAFYLNNKDKGFVIRDYDSFTQDCGHSVLITATNSNEVYVAFDGTDSREWVDNGEGMFSEATDQQLAAMNRFDDYVRAYGLNENQDIYVTGHSKGGNKAMFVTMESENAGLIKQCIALDGQGFSPEAIDRWRTLYGDEYENAVDKITLIKGKNDFVNQLGITIAPHQYTIGYNDWLGADEDNYTLYSYHDHKWLFTQDADGNIVLNSEDSPSDIDEYMKKFMAEYMSLSREDRIRSAPKLMNIIQLFKTGEINNYSKTQLMKDIDDLLVILSETDTGSEIIKKALNLLKAIGYILFNKMGLIWAGILDTYIATVKTRAWYNSLKNKKKKNNENGTNNSTIVNHKSSGSRNGKKQSSSGGSGKEITLNKEAFEGLYPRFESVFSLAVEGAQYAEKAESLNHDLSTCGSLVKCVANESNSIKELIKRIIDSFTSVDNENRKEAENLIGVEFYNVVSNGGSIIYDSDGNYQVQYKITDFTPIVQRYNNCTNSSLAMMIQRYYLLHTGKCDLVYDQYNTSKGTFYDAVEHYGRIKSNDLPNGGHYQTGGGYPSDLRACGGGNPQAGLVAQLNAHPEGVVIYAPYGSGTGEHAVLISGYQVNADGSYSFTAIDPANGLETPLTDSTLYNNRKQYGSVDDLLNNLFFYQYLESVT